LAKITKDTLVPISLVITIVLVTVWLSQTHFTASANAKDIIEVKKDIKIIRRIDRRLSRIEGKLNIEPLTNEEGEN